MKDNMTQADFDSLVPPGGLNRRHFSRTALGAGFAAAAGPVAAQTAIRTPTTGLTVGEETVEVKGFKVPVYRAAPAGRKGAPVVLVISEIFGVHEHIADVANRFAQAGYFAIAPELFARAGDPQAYGEIAKLIAEIVMKTPDAQVMTDLDACLAWAQTQGADASRAAITGFCWGGRITWMYTAHQPHIKAGVAWYGRLEGAPNPAWPSYPIERVNQLNAPVLGLYGGRDDGIPVASVDRMKAALAQGSPAARRSEFVVYDEAPHAFHADYRPSYRREAAQDAWRRCLAWFKANGVA